MIGMMPNGAENRNARLPRIEIVEQPAPKALRFRYECEGRSAGSIPGVRSTNENKTYPTIQIVGYTGDEDIVVIVSCVTKDPPYRAHPHNLVGRECKDGICSIYIDKETKTATFSNLGIQCVKKKDIEAALKLREEKKVDPYKQGFDHAAHPSSIDLNSVRLCFQAIIKGKHTRFLGTVVSDPIYDKKAMSDLLITRLSHSSAPVKGGLEVMLFCEKVAKEDIKIRFFEEAEGRTVWDNFGEIIQVHKQVGIAFKTPPYRTLEINKTVNAYIQLYRPSDKATSDPLSFKFTSYEPGKHAFWLLRSLKPDFDILANILADKDHSLTRELLKIQRDSVSDDDEESNDELLIDERVSNVVYSDEDSSTNTLSNDDKCSTASWPFNNSFSSKEAIDKLMTAKEDRLKELGVVFSESEDADDLEGRHFLDFVSNVQKLKTPNKEEAHEDDKKTVSQTNESIGLYTSLQMSMKNKIKMPELRKIIIKPAPVEHYETISVPPRPSSTKPIFKSQPSLIESETLPPLPPKRVKKNPTKSLPAVPEKETKLAIIRKFLPKIGKSRKNAKTECNISRRSSIQSTKFNVNNTMSDSKISLNDSLTEAEHYALYTSVAPRATDSEFDENSCYYSPVEAQPVK